MQGYACRGLTTVVRRRGCNSRRLHFFRPEGEKSALSDRGQRPRGKSKGFHFFSFLLTGPSLISSRLFRVIVLIRRFDPLHKPVLWAVGIATLWVAGCASTPVISPPSPVATSPIKPRPQLPAAIRTVVLDPGHGGDDPGTSHFGLKEKTLVLDIARRVRVSLEAAGLSVVMTRDSDQFIPLSGRARTANRLPADLFVSIHINANRNRQVSGIEVYYPRVSEITSGATWPPLVRPAEVGVPSTTVRQVLWDMVLGSTRSQSRRLASCICRSMRSDLGAPCRGTKPARFVVLREAWMPAVLVEVGYVTNHSEATRLGSESYRQAAANAIARGIINYIQELGAQHI